MGRRVLIASHVTPRFPGPGAETRAYCLARELAKHFRITFLLPDHGEFNRSELEALKVIGQVETYTVEKKWWPMEWRIRRALKILDSARPFWVFDRSPSFVRSIEGLFPALRKKFNCIDLTNVELIHLVHPHLAPALDEIEKNVPTTLDWVDERTIAIRRNLQTSVPLHKRLGGLLEIDRVQRFQAKIAPRFDATFVASEVDADRLQSCVGGHRPVVVPNGVDFDYFRNPVVGRPEGNGLIFTGHMAYEPNVEAVVYFCRQILPAIVAEVPDTRIYIVGIQPHPAVLALEQQFPENVTVTGEVSDVRPYLAQCVVSVVPLRSGGGTRLKILEAMAMHRAVVSTAIGCEGLLIENDRHLLVRDDPKCFAQAVIELLDDAIKWNRLAVNGRELVEQRYDWKDIADTVASTWHTLIETKNFHGVSN